MMSCRWNRATQITSPRLARYTWLHELCKSAPFPSKGTQRGTQLGNFVGKRTWDNNCKATQAEAKKETPFRGNPCPYCALGGLRRREEITRRRVAFLCFVSFRMLFPMSRLFHIFYWRCERRDMRRHVSSWTVPLQVVVHGEKSKAAKQNTAQHQRNHFGLLLKKKQKRIYYHLFAA